MATLKYILLNEATQFPWLYVAVQLMPGEDPEPAKELYESLAWKVVYTDDFERAIERAKEGLPARFHLAGEVRKSEDLLTQLEKLELVSYVVVSKPVSVGVAGGVYMGKVFNSKGKQSYVASDRNYLHSRIRLPEALRDLIMAAISR